MVQDASFDIMPWDADLSSSASATLLSANQEKSAFCCTADLCTTSCLTMNDQGKSSDFVAWHDVQHDCHTSFGFYSRAGGHRCVTEASVCNSTAYLQLVKVVNLRDGNSLWVSGWIRSVQAVHISQQKQPVCSHKCSNLHQAAEGMPSKVLSSS